MTIKKFGALVCCVLALCLGFALVGCDGVEASKKAFCGEWSVEEMDQDGEITTAEDMALFRSLGLDVVLTLNDDLSAKLSIFGSEGDGTWEPETKSKATFVLDGQNIEMTIEDGKLHLKQDSTLMTFVRSEELEGTEEAKADEAAATTDEAAATTEDTAADATTTEDSNN